jgi:hypothetical protein
MILTGLTKPTREENEDQKIHKKKQDRKAHKRPEIEKNRQKKEKKTETRKMNFETRTLEDKLDLQKKHPTSKWESFRNKKPFKPPSGKFQKTENPNRNSSLFHKPLVRFESQTFQCRKPHRLASASQLSLSPPA